MGNVATRDIHSNNIQREYIDRKKGKYGNRTRTARFFEARPLKFDGPADAAISAEHPCHKKVMVPPKKFPAMSIQVSDIVIFNFIPYIATKSDFFYPRPTGTLQTLRMQSKGYDVGVTTLQ